MRWTLGAVVSSLALTGCWLQPGFDATRSNWNWSETTLTAATVGDIVELWDVQVPTATQVHDPLSHAGTIYVATGTNRADSGKVVAALDARSGTPRWTTDLEAEGRLYPEGYTTDPLYVEDELLLLYSRHYRSAPAWTHLAHLDPATGQVVTDEDLPGTGVPAAAGGTLAVPRMSGVPGSTQPGRMWISWTYEALVFSGTLTPDVVPTAGFAIAGDRLFTSRGTTALGFSPACPPPAPPETGCAPDWSTDISDTPTGVTALGPDGVVYTRLESWFEDDGTLVTEGRVHVLDAASGEMRWTAELGSAVDRRAAADEDTVFVGTRGGRLVAFPAGGCGAATCEPLWESTSLGTGVVGSPVIGGDVVYISTGGRILAFPADGCGSPTCAPLVTVDTGSLVTGGPIVDDGRLVAGLQDGRVVAYGLPS